MAHYMAQASYSSEAVSELVKNPQDRPAVIKALVERHGGQLEAFYYAFGDCDVVAIVELPDNVTMAAVAMALGSSGSLKSFKTTVLMTPEEGVEAMRKATTVSYHPPGR